jgi:uncharacterized protein (DUF736 family)
LTGLFNGGAGNNGETLLDAFSAVTDYYSHESSGGEDQPGFRTKQYLSSEFGSAAKKKQDFFRTLFKVSNDAPEFDRENFRATVENGKRVLAAADAIMAAN